MTVRLWKEFTIILTICCLLFFATPIFSKDAKYVRWSKSQMPLKVYIQKSPNIPGYRDSYPIDIAKALTRWKNDSNGLVDFYIVNDPSIANIKFDWVSKMTKEKATGQATGHSYVWGVTKLGNPTTITLVTKHPYNDKDTLSDQNLYMISLHEIGHALGIWWHTRDPQDIMYPDFLISSTNTNGAKMVSNKNRGTLSSRDIQNLNALYNNSNAISLNSVARGKFIQMPSYNNNVIGTVETTGAAAATVANKSSDLNIDLGKAIEYLKKNPNSYEAYNNIGLAYLESGNFDLAIQAFNKAISLNSLYSKAHLNLGITFIKMKKYDQAIASYQKYLDLSPNAENSSNVKKEIERIKTLTYNN